MSQQLIPSWQGQYDGFCGVYAIINALRLALEPIAPLRAVDCEKLFGFAVRLLDQRGELATSVQAGVELASWKVVAREIARYVERHYGITITLGQPLHDSNDVSFNSLLRTIRVALHGGDAVLVSLLGAYNHYTVIRSCSATRFRLFDSYGYAWLNIAACGVARPGTRARHQIEAASLITVRVELPSILAHSANKKGHM